MPNRNSLILPVQRFPQRLNLTTNRQATRIEHVGKPYREVCLQTKWWPWKVHQPNSRSKRSGTWSGHVLAYCRVERKYVGCIELSLKLYRALYRILEIVALTTLSADCAVSSCVTLWPWPLTFASINVYSWSTSYYLSTGQIWKRSDDNGREIAERR